MDLGRVEIQEEHHITGRGMVLLLDLVANELAVEPIKRLPINIGDTLIYRKENYIVNEIEATRKNEYIGKLVGLVVIAFKPKT